MLVVGVVALLSIAMGLMLSQRGSRTAPAAKPAPVKTAANTPAPKPQVAAPQNNAAKPAPASSVPATSVPTTLALVPPSML